MTTSMAPAAVSTPASAAVSIRRKPDGSIEKLIDLAYLSKVGFGDRGTINSVVRERQIPVFRVGGRRGKVKIWESDIPLLLEPVIADEA